MSQRALLTQRGAFCQALQPTLPGGIQHQLTDVDVYKQAGGFFVSKVRKSATSLAAAALMLAGTAVAAPSAQAAYTDCPSQYACLWTGNSYPGAPNASFKSSIVLSSSNNLINSIVNNGISNIAYFYDAGNHTGLYITLNNPARGGQSRDPYLANGTDATTANWANRISSAKF